MTANQAQAWVVGVGVLYALGSLIVYNKTHPPTPQELVVQVMRQDFRDAQKHADSIRHHAELEVITAECKTALRIATTWQDSVAAYQGRGTVMLGIPGHCMIDSLHN